MKTYVWLSRAAAALLILNSAACNEPKTPNAPGEPAVAAMSAGVETIYGAPVKLGQGTARSYIEIDHGVVKELGVALSAAALKKLPGDHDGKHGGHGFEHILPLPSRNPTPYRNITLDWNPVGHEPPGIYDRPHFDFHFYTITNAERMTIDPADPLFAQKAMNAPSAEYIPTGYLTPPPPAAVPFMGVHWIDPASPEFNGQGFTRTFLYGTFDGKLIFTEPMITKAFLESKPNATFPIPVAERYSPAGVYPSSYTVKWDATRKQYRVALTGFVAKS